MNKTKPVPPQEKQFKKTKHTSSWNAKKCREKETAIHTVKDRKEWQKFEFRMQRVRWTSVAAKNQTCHLSAPCDVILTIFTEENNRFYIELRVRIIAFPNILTLYFVISYTYISYILNRRYFISIFTYLSSSQT